MNSLNIQVPAGQIVPADAIAPVKWATVAAWFRETEDEGRTFQSRIRLFFPNGEIAQANTGLPFMLNQTNVQNITRAFGFPITQQGLYTVSLDLREIIEDQEIGDEEGWHEISRSPIHVAHIEQEGGENP